MHPILRSVLAIVSGMFIGSAMNMGIILISGKIIPPPLGIDNTTLEGLKASMHLFEPKHFLMPFLAHALGTLVGAFVAAFIAPKNKMRYAFVIGLIFLSGGVANIFMLPSPLWFSLTDAIGAYLPMAYLAGSLVEKRTSQEEIKSDSAL